MFILKRPRNAAIPDDCRGGLVTQHVYENSSQGPLLGNEHTFKGALCSLGNTTWTVFTHEIFDAMEELIELDEQNSI